MKILKFGGTSVGTADSIRKVVDILLSYKKKKQEFSVVFSAMSGITNQLIEVSKKAAESNEDYHAILKSIENKHINAVKSLIDIKVQSKVVAHIKMLINELEDLLHGVFLLKELSPRTTDLVVSFGERMSTYIVSEFMKQSGLDTEFCDARKLIVTDHSFGAAIIDFKATDKNIKEHFKATKKIQAITGFISSTVKGETTTLGRGGSDYTASVLGAALGAEEIEIWTDVDGVMTADPKKVKGAFTLPAISYVEAMEMSHFGAKVIYPPTLQPAFNKKIPIWIKNTFNPEFEGTYISAKTKANDFLIKGISSIREIALISLQGSGMMGVPGVSARLFGSLAKKKINVILITQASSEYSICFAVEPKEAEYAAELINEEFANEIQAKKIDNAIVEYDLSIVAIIGENMRNTPGIAGKFFASLGKNGVNIRAIAQGSSELNLSVVIGEHDLSKALNSLHESFFLSDIRTLNVFVVGLGLIGSTLLKQIQKQSSQLLKERLLKINIIGIANSKKMLLDENGINLKDWNGKLEKDGEKMKMSVFVEKMKSLNLQNSVFVDSTSSKDVVEHYEDILNTSISIVTPNKLANSGLYKDYQKIQSAAFKHGVKFLYETNVGAGLPVINTLKDLKYSGDKILKIEGILSGTLSFIFNTFKEGTKFSEVVKEAKEKGYTEPDPRDDLNGMDVARKILILAREANYTLEIGDVNVENILPEPCRKAKTIEDFFVQLEKNNDVFSARRDEAAKKGNVLRFIATLENGKARVSLEAVGPAHPFYSLSGSDNMIAFTTERYKDRPLVIKGPGAGAEVTAAGVFAEIISISNYLKSFI
ncbi:bifunctional aspartokinase I/homoserine dehydrogenase I [Sporocytophaga myxococcoides]|uniref:Bifunctional aspartokinase I/homoserine dehydrogenase I n=1 Tax=Sporocytophaga myxococcoides TaxID=153721 RepID=A0A098LAI2_9BACT|nr:bifunctional aspartate kinase/homoserine dehydrogenase I [Sporocytophaga myxococcoides]GAL83951.1 bifunctional aspartokinase I/homoserine dehydrogenase I [Sporocytophaga myxococcoides]